MYEGLMKSVITNKTELKYVFWLSGTMNPASLHRILAGDEFTETDDDDLLFHRILMLSSVLS
jgi:hypothetical protein